MKKKPTKQEPRKEKSSPKPLHSRQWQSASTLTQRATNAPDPQQNSPSATAPPPPDPCKDAKKPPKSAQWPQVKPDFSTEPPDPKTGGNTTWNPPPTFAVSAYCNNDAGVWTFRVTGVTAGLQVRLSKQPKGVNDAAIKSAKNCGELGAMFENVFKSMSEIGSNAHTPVDVLKDHEMVHVGNSLAYASSLYADFVGDIEVLSVDCEDAKNADDAKRQVAGAIESAVQKYNDKLKLKDVLDQHHEPDRNAFLDAQWNAGYPWLKKVADEMDKRGCPHPPLPPENRPK